MNSIRRSLELTLPIMLAPFTTKLHRWPQVRVNGLK